MADDTHEGIRATRQAMLAVAQSAFWRAALALDEGIGRVRSGDMADPAITPRMVTEYDKALQTLLDRIAKVEEMERKEGDGGGYGLDLGAARAEVGRRLAGLAADADQGEIPE
ncbi:MAG: hypothetical protein WDA25_00705 [Paracoccaceae bacterium]